MKHPSTTEHQVPAVCASRNWVKKQGYRIMEEYKALLSIPNHASDLVNIRRNAEMLLKMFGSRGFDMKTLEIGGAPPIVYGECRVENAVRTLCFYVHYDGQPVDPGKWVNPPFKPRLYDAAIEAGGAPIPFPGPGDDIDKEWRIYARSASDDKAPLIALAAALDALMASKIGLTSNIKLFFDGEEESSSPHVEAYLSTYRDLLADITVWLFCDGGTNRAGSQSG
jgi:acetylornithine deacetylase/succinyl-diaminopimelate desuccinylase-like protein